MFLIKKLICVVAILLVAVLGVSLVSRSFEIGIGGSSSKDGYTGIGLPTDGSVLLSLSDPLYKSILNRTDEMKESNCFYVERNSLIRYRSDAPPVFSGRESVGMRFDPLEAKNGFDLSDYTHFKIEFDIRKTQLGDSVLGCSFGLVGRNSSDDSESLSVSRSTIQVDLEALGDEFRVETYNGKQIIADRFHVVYLVEVNHDNYNHSRMQVFINDVLYEDSVYYDGLFSNKDVDRLTAVTVTNFNTDSNNAVVCFDNLVVTGYQEVGD